MPGPKALVFPTTPVQPVIVVPTPSPVAQVKFVDPPKKTQPAAPIFANGNESQIEVAFKHIKSKYTEIAVQSEEEIRRQISQLYPFNVTEIMDWGSLWMSNATQWITRVSETTKQHTSLGINTALSEAMQSMSPKGLKKLFGRGNPTVHLTNLVQLRQPAVETIGAVDQLMRESAKIKQKLTVRMVTIGAVLDLADTTAIEESIEQALHNRYNLLIRSLQQFEFSLAQLTSLKTLITNDISRLDEMTNSTIPTFLAAN